MKSLTGSSELISLLLYIIVIASISHCCKQCTNGDTFTVIKSIIIIHQIHRHLEVFPKIMDLSVQK